MSIITVTTPKGVDYALNYLKNKSAVGFDVETEGLNYHKHKILTMQIGDTYKQFVFDLFKIEEHVYRILDFLKREDVEKVGHYLKFDYAMVLSNYGVSLPNLVCTHVGSSLLTKGILSADNSLDGCLTKYLNVSIDKSQQKSFTKTKYGDPLSKEQLEYAGIDVKYLLPLRREIQELIDKRDMSELYDLECFTVRVCGDMEVSGIYLDKDMWLALEGAAKDRMKAAKEKLDKWFIDYLPQDIFGEPVINYNSPQQLLPVLQKVTGQNIKDTSAQTLKSLTHPAVKDLLSFREAVKKVTTYGEEFIKKNIHPVTGRVHSAFRQLGTDSGRMASRNPNMQNIPSEDEYRACFRAQTPDYKIISADFSGQELALMAYISQEDKFLYALKNEMDLHCYSASLIFDLDYSDFFYFGEQGKKEAVKDDDKLDITDLELNKDGAVVDKGEIIIRPNMKKKYRTPAKSITFGLWKITS